MSTETSFSFSLVKAEAERASQFKQLCEACQLSFIEVNAAQLTREGTSGNSLSKVLSPLMQMGGKPTVVFVDEFDKLFISGNSNGQLANEATTCVQK